MWHKFIVTGDGTTQQCQCCGVDVPNDERATDLLPMCPGAEVNAAHVLELRGPVGAEVGCTLECHYCSATLCEYTDAGVWSWECKEEPQISTVVTVRDWWIKAHDPSAWASV